MSQICGSVELSAQQAVIWGALGAGLPFLKEGEELRSVREAVGHSMKQNQWPL
jgi:hypothetical protein